MRDIKTEKYDLPEKVAPEHVPDVLASTAARMLGNVHPAVGQDKESMIRICLIIMAALGFEGAIYDPRDLRMMNLPTIPCDEDETNA